MRRPFYLSIALIIFALVSIPHAQAAPDPAAIASVEDDPGLPRVLLIGDSISIGYTLAVRDLLAGKANVHRIPINGGPTSRGLEQIDAWLQDGAWDVIHFNWFSIARFDLSDANAGVARNPRIERRVPRLLVCGSGRLGIWSLGVFPERRRRGSIPAWAAGPGGKWVFFPALKARAIETYGSGFQPCDCG